MWLQRRRTNPDLDLFICVSLPLSAGPPFFVQQDLPRGNKRFFVWLSCDRKRYLFGRETLPVTACALFLA